LVDDLTQPRTLVCKLPAGHYKRGKPVQINRQTQPGVTVLHYYD